MSEQAASPLGNTDMGDIGAALAAGAQGGGTVGAINPEVATPAVAPKTGAPVMQSLDFILDIPLKVTVELGRSKMAIRDILQLAQGSVIELAKFAGEPLEVLVNDKLIARGEVVVVNEKFGIRLTDILSPVERIEQLK